MRARWAKNKKSTITPVITKDKQNNNNIELDKERIIDKFSSVSKDKDNILATDILNTQG
jgi:hypothetical protein